ncbi:MAG: hypothetical protein ACR2N5_00930 [Solirubrobacterales bacterium]
MNEETIYEEIAKERERQVALAHGGDTESFDRTNTQSDWVAYIAAYSGRASRKVFRNLRDGNPGFRENMVKVAALAVAAIEAFDAGHCRD